MPLPMRARLLFLPALAAAAMPAPARAVDYLTVAQARALIFPGAKFTDAAFEMSDGEVVKVGEVSLDASVWRRKVPAWKASTGGLFFLDQCLGRGDIIIFALGLDASGAVKGLEILVCVGTYDQVRKPEWTARFVGCRRDGKDPADVVPNISGTTQSAQHLIGSVRKLLLIHQIMKTRKLV